MGLVERHRRRTRRRQGAGVKRAAKRTKPRRRSWYVYMAECGDGSLYTGITNDVEKRLAAHNAGRGAKYTRSRLPLKVLRRRRCADKGKALSLEFKIKSWSAKEKRLWAGR